MIITQPIRALTLLLSAGCNLQCEYCLLHKSKNSNSSLIQHQTICSLKNGEYLKNTLKVLERLQSSPLYIEHMEFWGQEPTLSLQHFTDNLQEWYAVYPNIKTFLFSTNGKEHADRIINFIIKLDNIVTHQTNVNIQFSYDEEYSNHNCRHIDSNSITNNINFIITELNKINLSNVNVRFNFHSVISKNLINNLQDIEQVNNYCKNLFEWPKQFIKLNQNLKVKIREEIDFGIEVPIEASQSDGIKFAHFCKLMNKCPYNVEHNKIISDNLKRLLISDVRHTFNDLLEPEDTIIKLLQNNLNNNELNKELSLRHSFCGANYLDLKIMYDGTLISCQNQIFDTDISYINQDDKLLYSIKKNDIIHKKILNPITASDAELKKLFYSFQIMKENNFKIIYNNVLNLMYILAKNNQIDTNYIYNKNKILNFAFYLCKYNNCSYNSMIKTGNSFFKNCGMIRFFCNGALQEIIGDN